MSRPGDDVIYGTCDGIVVCPKCQARCAFEGPRAFGIHQVFDAKCLNPDCKFEFLADADEEEERLCDVCDKDLNTHFDLGGCDCGTETRPEFTADELEE